MMRGAVWRSAREEEEELRWQPSQDTPVARISVGTWNVGGRAPHGGLDLADWLRIDGPASSSSPHIYVLGFQEIVPLNAGNVLGAEDKGPARKWLDLIRRALNPPCSAAGPAGSGSGSSRSRRRSPSGRVSFSDLLLAAADDDDDSCRPSTASWSEPDDHDYDLSTTTPSTSSSEEETPTESSGYYYRLAASKQMVGVLLSVWVRADAAPRVGTGVLGYMGNKGAVSVSLALRGGAGAAATALCFVCTHLASCDRPGDAARRNADVAEILRRTRFARTTTRRRLAGGTIDGRPPPETILEHDKVIWLGDLNYRLVAGNGGGCGARELVEREDWEALLERDELRAEQSAGRVFAAGWEEGRIRFPPTYKYVADSDAYAIDDDYCSSSSSSSVSGGSGSWPREKKTKKKKRTPAWCECDRILWRGEGMEQQWYARGESRFSDHRPVSVLFSISAPLHDDNAAAADEKMLLVARCPRRSCCPAPPHSSRF